MKKLFLFLIFTASLFAQYDPDYWYYYANQGRNQVKYGNFNGSVYAYRNYSAADTLLNTHSSEFTVLPQSNMKINFTNIRKVNNFSSASDTTDNSYGFKSYGDATSTITNGKLRVTHNSSGWGIISRYTLPAGSIFYVKYKARLVSGSPIPFNIYNGYNFGPEGRQITFSSEETTYEQTIFLRQAGPLFFIGSTGTNGQVVEYDDIEVREVINLVSNGALTVTPTGWSTLPMAGIVWDDNLKKFRMSNTTTIAFWTSFSSSSTFPNGTIGRRFIVTYQIDSVSVSGSGIRSRMHTGNASAYHTTSGVYSDTIIATAGGATYVYFDCSGFSGTLDNIHLYEIPAYYSQSGSNHKVGWTKQDYMVDAGDSTALKMISTGVGDSVYNNIKIVSGSNTFHSFEKDKKYTIEAWARGTGVKGSNILTGDNTNFTTSIGAWTGLRGTVVLNSGTLLYTSDGTSGSNTAVIGALTSGLTYEISFKAKSTNMTTAFSVSLVGGANSTVAISNPNLTTDFQDYKFLGSATSISLRIDLGSNLIAGKDFSLDDVVIKVITQPTITLQTQGQTKSFTGISCVPNTFTKLVWNFQANATYGIDTLKMWTNQADTVYIDSVNIKQFYPTTISGWFKTNTNGTIKRIISKSTNVGVNPAFGFQISISADNYLYFYLFSSNAGISVNSARSVTDGNWHFFTALSDIDSLKLFVDDNVYQSSVNTSGNTNNIQDYTLARNSYSSVNFFNGSIGEIMQVRNYAASQSEHLANYQRGMSGLGIQIPPTGTVAFYQNWAGNNLTEVSKDKSGNNYDLTLSGISFTDIFAIEGYK